MSSLIKTKLAILGVAVVVFTVILMSWGIKDLESFLEHPARMILLLLLLVQFIVVTFWVPLGSTSTRLPNQVIQENMLIAFIGAMGVLLFLMISPFSDRQGWMQLSGGDMLRYVGVFLFALGAFFNVWAPIHMHNKLSNQGNQESHLLITDGPFRYVRHPRDFGGILMFISIPLVFLSGLGLLLACISSAGLLERIGREEQILQQQFKEEWFAYAQRTKCLIPWINRV